MKNRNIYPSILALLMVAVFALPVFAQRSGKAKRNTRAQRPAASQRIDISSSSSTREILRIQTVLEGRGTVIPEEDKTMPMRLDARFQYDERVIARSSQLKSIRSYDQALAKILLDNKRINNRLPSDKSIIISQTKGADLPIQLASLGGPISQKQFELINTSANSLILAEIFRKRSVKKGDTWNPNKQILARFLNIDSIEETDVLIELAAIKANTATLVIAGETKGTIDGASTELSLNGSVRFDISRGIVSDATITISQKRDIGLLAPGLDATFKMITKIRPVTESQHLTNDGLAALRKKSGSISDDLLLTPESSNIAILHPRNWRVIADHPGRTILRYNYHGRMIGQCDIIPLPNRLPEQEQTLEQFKSVVKNSLSESSAEIRGADQSTTKNGLDWLRVDAAGANNGVNLQWSYFTITHTDGRRVQLVFTTEPENAASFSGLEKDIIDSIEFEITTAGPDGSATPAKKISYEK